MKRLLTITALAAICLAIVYPTPARANYYGVTIKNESDKCAWMTIYWATFYTPWEILNHDANDRPQFLRPGQSHRFDLAYVSELKIRAEVTKTADCTGGTIADTYDVRKNGDSGPGKYIDAVLMNNGKGYNLWFK